MPYLPQLGTWWGFDIGLINVPIPGAGPDFQMPFLSVDLSMWHQQNNG